MPVSYANRTTIPTVRVNTGNPEPTSLIVNNRNLGARGDLSQGFGENSNVREKMKLRRMVAQSNSELYENNPVAQRRMQQQYALKAGELYGIDPKKLMNANSQTVAPSGQAAPVASPSSNYAARGGAWGSAPSNDPWNSSTTYRLKDKIQSPARYM